MLIILHYLGFAFKLMPISTTSQRALHTKVRVSSWKRFLFFFTFEVCARRVLHC